MRSSAPVNPAKRKLSHDSDAMASSPGPASRVKKRLSAETWESKRQVITKLYQEEKRPLKEVMEIMLREHKFDATVKMYKSRIWKWGLDKKLKGDEVLHILLLKHERDAMNKRSEFTIRGQPVDLDNIYRYVKRNPGLMARYQAGSRPSHQTSIEVQCRTPSPSPPRTLAPTPEMRNVEVVLTLFRDYIDSQFQNNAWEFEYNDYCVGRGGDRSIDLFERVIASFALVNRCMVNRDQISLDAMLGPSFESLKEIVHSESPVLVVRTACLIWYLDRHHKHDLLRLVLDYLSGLVPIVLGPNHPMAHIWRLLATTQFTDYYQLSLRLYAMLAPELERRIGSANYLTHILYSDYTDCLYYEGSGLNACESIQRQHLAKAQATGKTHDWLQELAFEHSIISAAILEEQGRLDEALRLQISYMRENSLSEEQEAVTILEIGVRYKRLRDPERALPCFKESARLVLTLALDDRILNTSLANMEKLLTEEERTGEAQQVLGYRMDRLKTFATKSLEISRGSNNFDDDLGLVSIPSWLGPGDGAYESEAVWLTFPDHYPPPPPPSSVAPRSSRSSTGFDLHSSGVPTPERMEAADYLRVASPHWTDLSADGSVRVSPSPYPDDI